MTGCFFCLIIEIRKSVSSRLKIMKKLWDGILHAIDWLTRDTPYKTNVERLAILKQALFDFR